MKEIIKYQACDNSEFYSKEECIQYESLIGKVNNILTILKPIPDTCDFVNGGGYVQQDASSVSKFRNAILDLLEPKISHRWIKESRDLKVHPSYVERLIEDGALNPIRKSWGRLSCIDNSFREYGQPYYASHPNETVDFKEVVFEMVQSDRNSLLK